MGLHVVGGLPIVVTPVHQGILQKPNAQDFSSREALQLLIVLPESQRGGCFIFKVPLDGLRRQVENFAIPQGT